MRRREFLRAGAGAGLIALLPPGAIERALADAPRAGQAGRFLSAHELDTLRALVDRLIPGPPEDPDPGGVQMLVPEAIDAFLGAFTFDPPLIHAGGPFSDRNGHTPDDFAHFRPLDKHAELGWRIRLEGSKGMPEREFAGPVTGLQEIYKAGLKSLDDASPGGSFAALPSPAQESVMSGDQTGFVSQAFNDALNAMYGPPEYRLDKQLGGWTYIGWGDNQPRGHTPEEVSGAGGAGERRAGPEIVDATRALLPHLAARWRR